MVSGFHIFGIVDCVDLDLYDLHFCTTSASTQCKKLKNLNVIYWQTLQVPSRQEKKLTRKFGPSVTLFSGSHQCSVFGKASGVISAPRSHWCCCLAPSDSHLSSTVVIPTGN